MSVAPICSVEVTWTTLHMNLNIFVVIKFRKMRAFVVVLSVQGQGFRSWSIFNFRFDGVNNNLEDKLGGIWHEFL